MPSFGADKPLSYYQLPGEERESRCDCGSDGCVIDKKYFFVQGCLELSVIGAEESFVWGVWVSLSQANFKNG